MTISAYELNFNLNAINLTIKTARDGDVAAVQKLLDAGASLADAIYGYAFGGHEEEVTALLANHPNLKAAAAQGYARAGNKAQISNLNAIEDLKIHLLIGYAQAGDESQIRAALNAQNGNRYLPSIIAALASTAQKKILFEFLNFCRFNLEAVQAAARSGHSDLVETLLLDFMPSETALNYALLGYSEGRHFPEALDMIKRGAHPLHCVNALAALGTINTTDASMLLGAAHHDAAIEKSLKELMKSQFGLKHIVAIDIGTNMHSLLTEPSNYVLRS